MLVPGDHVGEGGGRVHDHVAMDKELQPLQRLDDVQAIGVRHREVFVPNPTSPVTL